MDEDGGLKRAEDFNRSRSRLQAPDIAALLKPAQ
jgi:hypothetical protein